MKKILQKHIIGVVHRGVFSELGLRSPKVVTLLLKLGKIDPKQSLTELHSSSAGLTANEVKERQKIHGKNEVVHEKPPAWWIQLLKSFANPFIAILIVLGGASFVTDVLMAATADITKVIILGTMVSVSGFLRFWQEFRSQKAAEKLQALVQNKALVNRQNWDEDAAYFQNSSDIKNGKREIPVTELVPGDIVHLSAGDMVPADLRLLQTQDLFVSQSALTGESMPIEKLAIPTNVEEKKDQIKDKETTNPLELNTLCFMGTNVVSGSATGIIVATANQTNFGSMAKSVVGERSLTSFDKGINKVSWVLIGFMACMVPIVFVINGVVKHNWMDAFFFALAIAVGLTPEMLPLVVTANLAKGAMSMAKKKVIIKKLNAIQNFGAMDILCTDKTGTITENRVVLIRHLDPQGKESDRVLRLAYLNSFFQTGLKNLMDQAVVERMEKTHADSEEKTFHKVDEIPFDFGRRRMSVIVQKAEGEHMLICKGAVEEILKFCTSVEHNGKVTNLTDLTQKEVRKLTTTLNEEGLRVIAVAYKQIDHKKHIYSVADENDLTLVGYIGFLDPPKASAKDAITLLEAHGVKVKIITGDNDIVTARICKDVGLKSGKILLGSDVEYMSDEGLSQQVEQTSIFAKIDPLQKARIVEALRKTGYTVGYMGDGVNDAAAMREADVGISVDTGVDIAKEAADIILLENDLMVLERGVIEGRTIFGNIMKYIKMTSSSNFGNVLSVLTASIFLPFLPMLPIHLLIQNLLYDFSQLSIPVDTMDPEFLKKPRKWEAKGISRFMIFIGPISSIFDITTFLVMWFVFHATTPAMQSLFQSGWFVEGLLSQTLIVHMIRTQKIPFFQSKAATPVILLTATIMLLGIAIPFSGFGQHIGLQPLPFQYFPILVATLLSYCILTQIIKTWYIKKFKVWL